MSRAQWLALGSALALTSCGGVTDGGHTGTQQSSQRGGDQGDAEADSGQGSTDDSGTVDEAGEAPDVVATGTNCSASYPRLLNTAFACAGQSCNAATQYCDLSYDGTQVACEDDTGGGYFPPQCLSCPTCDCVSQYLSGPSCKCVDVGGALGLGGGIGVQCAGCYGAPPTRLELLAA